MLYVPSALRALLLYVLRALPYVLSRFTYLISYMLCSDGAGDVSLQDPLIYVNLNTLIHQPVFIRKPGLRRSR